MKHPTPNGVGCLFVKGLQSRMNPSKFVDVGFYLCYNELAKEIFFGGNTMKFIGNIIWLFIYGLWFALLHFAFGIALCATVIFIPLAKR